MQPYGPLTLTANTLTRVQCSPASTNVYVGNDSPYDVLVSFSVSQPAMVTAANGNPEWASIVQAFHHAVLPTPANIGSPQGSGYTGNVWLLPLDTRGGGQVNLGSVSTLANAWVIACMPGEAPPDAYAAPRQTDLSSQARVLALPPAPSNITPGTLYSLVPGTTPTITTVNAAYRTDQLVPNTPIGSTFDKNIFYLYWLSITFGTATNAPVGFAIGVQATKHDGSNGTYYDIFYGFVSSANGLLLQPSAPIAIAISNPDPGLSSTYRVLFRVYSNALTTTTILQINFGWDLDLSNGIQLPTPGGGQLQAAGLVVNNTRFRF